MPLGLALAVAARWGRSMLLAAVLGMGTASLALGPGWDWGTAAVLAGTLGCAAWVGLAALHKSRFDVRLDRPRDVLTLTASVALAAAPVAAVLGAAWLTSAAGQEPWSALAQGWVIVSLGMLLTAVPVRVLVMAMRLLTLI